MTPSQPNLGMTTLSAKNTTLCTLIVIFFHRMIRIVKLKTEEDLLNSKSDLKCGLVGKTNTEHNPVEQKDLLVDA